MFRTLLCAALLVQAGAMPIDPYVPAQYRGGAPPPIPVRAVSGGEVSLEVSVSRDAVVTGIKVLRQTPPFTDAMTAAIHGWRFTPAEEEVAPAPGVPPVVPPRRERVNSTVLVVGTFLPPTLNTPTLGEPPKDVAGPASFETPFPLSTTTPQYPPRALMAGVVIVEVLVGPDGNVAQATVVSSAPPFDQAALDAASKWQFRPGRVRGAAVSKFAYLVFGFPQPVTSR